VSDARPLPWTELVEAIGEPRFGEIRDALAQAGIDDLDRDAFLLNGAVTNLLKDLMPEEAPAEAVSAYAALLHACYVTWARDWPVAIVGTDALKAALHAPALPSTHAPTVCYVQLPERQVWAEPEPGAAHEPLDGIFLMVREGRADVLAILGFRPGRDGFTTMEGAIAVPAPAPPARADGAPAFASALPAGERAGLVSVVDAHELAALALFALDAASR